MKRIMSRLQLTDRFILFRASGKILKAYAQDFEALSKDGHMFVVVQNTGYVTADFSVSLIFILWLIAFFNSDLVFAVSRFPAD